MCHSRLFGTGWGAQSYAATNNGILEKRARLRKHSPCFHYSDWLSNYLCIEAGNRAECRPRTHPLGFWLFFVFFYLLSISHTSMSHRSKVVMVKGEQLPGNCVLLGKGSLMAPAGPALWALACVCREVHSCTSGFLTCSYHNSELEALNRVCWH